jgi:hypothetical protein
MAKSTKNTKAAKQTETTIAPVVETTIAPVPNATEQKTETKAKRVKKVVEPRPCACACGGLTKKTFCPGHDGRIKGLAIAAVKAARAGKDALASALLSELSDGARAYVASTQDDELGRVFGTDVEALELFLELTGTEQAA